MNKSKTSAFQFTGYKIERSLIEIRSTLIGENFNISFEPKGTINKTESIFQLDLAVSIKDKEDAINIEVDIMSLFSFDGQIEKNQLQQLFYQNAPAIIFPYIRAYITTLTALSGIDPVIIPTLNLSGLGKELENNTLEL